MKGKGVLDYIPLQFLSFEVVAVVLIIGLLAAIIAFYCLAVGINISNEEVIKIKPAKKKTKIKRKSNEQIYIEEDDFATEEEAETSKEQISEYKNADTLKREANFDDLNLNDINLDNIDLKELEKSAEEEQESVNLGLSMEDEMFLEELKKTFKDENKTETITPKEEKLIENYVVNSVGEKKTEEKEVSDEDNLKLSLKEKMKQYAENLKNSENEDENLN